MGNRRSGHGKPSRPSSRPTWSRSRLRSRAKARNGAPCCHLAATEPMSRNDRTSKPLKKLERETGFEPATNSLEGCDSTPELLPQKAKRGHDLPQSERSEDRIPPLLHRERSSGWIRTTVPEVEDLGYDSQNHPPPPVTSAARNGGGGWIRTTVGHKPGRFTVCCLCPLGYTSAPDALSPPTCQRLARRSASWSRHSESNRGPTAYKAVALPLSYAGRVPCDWTPRPQESDR